MKKVLLTFVLLVGIVAGLFAQKLTYQAVIRDNNQQLVVNTAVKATVTITFTSGAPYQAEFNGSTNLHGLLSFEFGDETLLGRDWTNAEIAIHVVNTNTHDEYVGGEPRPVSAVPYALSVDGQSIQKYLEEKHYVDLTKLNDTLDAYSTTAAMDARHYLTSDSAVIKTMQNNISRNANSIDNLILHTAKAAIRDSVAGQINDSISNIAAKAHTHDNKALLDTYTQTEANLAEAVSKKHSHDNMTVLNATTAPYTDADSTKLDGIAAGAEVNVQSDWKQTDGSEDDYIKNKPSITDTVNNILSTGGYVTADALDSRHYLRSDSTVITTMQGNITANATNITSLQSGLSAATVKEKTDSTTLAGRIDALENASMDCNDVKDCIKDTLSKYTMTDVLNGLLQQLEARLTGKIDSLAHVVDSLAKLPHGGGEVADGQPCPGAKTVSDGTNTYNTVKIGNQCWMKENLRTTTMRNGAGNIYTNKTQAGYNAETYGYYYDWAAVMQNESGDTVRGICPEGWHVPSDAEWTALTDYVKGKTEYQCDGVADNIANALSAATGWNTPEECAAGHNSTTLNKTGFSAVPAGRYFYGINDFGINAYFWSATQHVGGYGPWSRGLDRGTSTVDRNESSTDNGYSVRCLKDEGGSSATLPTVTTDSASTVTNNSAKLYGNVTNMGGKDNVYAGFKYGTSESALTSIVAKDAAMTATGLFSCDITGLTANTQYYFKAFAANGTDTVYGELKNITTAAAAFTCGTDSVKDVDNNWYHTVKIGNQCWMKENLRTNVGDGVYPKKNDGQDDLTPDEQVTYGRLYTWTAMMNGKASSDAVPSGVRGICPEGWHVPSNAEWAQLTTYVNSVVEYRCKGNNNHIANALSIATGWQNSNECEAGHGGSTTLNATGFSAVPAGYCPDGSFSDFGNEADFWSATLDDDGYAKFRYLLSYGKFVYNSSGDKNYGLSVRCLKD